MPIACSVPVFKFKNVKVAVDRSSRMYEFELGNDCNQCSSYNTELLYFVKNACKNV